MNPMETSQRILIWLCIFPAKNDASKLDRIHYAAFTVIVVTSVVTVMLGSGTFLWKYSATNLKDSVIAFSQFTSFLGMTYMILVALVSKRKIAHMLEPLSTICNANADCHDSFRYLVRANNTSEWMWKIFFKYIISSFITLAITGSPISVLIHWLRNEPNAFTKAYLPLQLALPWNQKTGYGYLMEITLDTVVCAGYLIITATFLILFISLCVYHRAFYEIFRHSLRKAMHKNRNKRKAMANLINFHNSAKELFFESAHLYSTFIVIQLICNLILLSYVVFQFDMLLKEVSFYLTLMIMVLFVSISNLFVYCYFGQIATESYEKMGDCLWETNWYELSIDMQKYFLFMIQNVQQLLFYHGFGVAILNLETFSKLMKAVVSYYMVFKHVMYK